jgi:hypothetical protein
MRESFTVLTDMLLRAFGRGIARAWHGGSDAGRPPPRVRTRRARPSDPRADSVPPTVALAVSPRRRSGHEVVRYRQGRGFFDARIVRFDQVTKMITLERLADGKRLVRPASKVYPAER